MEACMNSPVNGDMTNRESWVNPLRDEASSLLTPGQLAEQFYLFIQTPLDRRGMLGMVSVYRTYVHYS